MTIVPLAVVMIGVPLGAWFSTNLRLKLHRADPLICGIGLAITTHQLFNALFFGFVQHVALSVIITTLVVDIRGEVKRRRLVHEHLAELVSKESLPRREKSHGSTRL